MSVLGGKNSREKKLAPAGSAAIFSVIFSVAIVGDAAGDETLEPRLKERRVEKEGLWPLVTGLGLGARCRRLRSGLRYDSTMLRLGVYLPDPLNEFGCRLRKPCSKSPTGS